MPIEYTTLAEDRLAAILLCNEVPSDRHLDAIELAFRLDISRRTAATQIRLAELRIELARLRAGRHEPDPGDEPGPGPDPATGPQPHPSSGAPATTATRAETPVLSLQEAAPPASGDAPPAGTLEDTRRDPMNTPDTTAPLIPPARTTPARRVRAGAAGIALALAAGLPLAPRPAAASPPIEWIREYNTPPAAADTFNAVAFDSEGNVICVGTTNSTGADGNDLLVAKYRPDGTLAWRDVYDGLSSADDAANAVSINSRDDIFVCGTTSEARQGDNLTVIRYRASGTREWVGTYNLLGNSTERGLAVVAAPDGTVYACGELNDGGATGTDSLIVKFSVAGQVVWTRRLAGPGAGPDSARAIAFRPSRNDIAVAGNRTNLDAGDGADMVLTLFLPDGTQAIQRTWDGPSGRADTCADMAVAPDSTIYLAGTTTTAAQFTDYALVKCSTAGSVLWAATWNGPESLGDTCRAVDVDATGNAYITGSSGTTSARVDYLTAKFSPAGALQWTSRYQGPADDLAFDIATDPAGNSIVTGYVFSFATSLDAVTVGYTPDGHERWVHTFVADGGEVGAAAAVGPGRRRAVAGSLFRNPTGTDGLAVRYAPDCPADFNGDGAVDSDDFFDYLNAFFAGDPSADVNNDGTVDSDDFFDFLNAFGTGC